jgi:hypothetical protein
VADFGDISHATAFEHVSTLKSPVNLLTPIKFGWKALQDRINDLIGAVNARTVIIPTGGGLDFRETPNGILIALSGNLPNAASGATAGSPTTAPQAVAGSGSNLTADQIALLKALASDPGINGTFVPTTPPIDHSTDTVPGPVEWLPYNDGKLTGWRRITYLSPFLDPTTGYSTNTLYDVWSWTGMPFNPRTCTANTFGAPTSS